MTAAAKSVMQLEPAISLFGVMTSDEAGSSIVAPPLPVRVAEIAGFRYLMDGHHRAVALRRLGHSHMPCLVLHDCNWAFLRNTPRRRRFEPAPFAREIPPCVGHFSSPAAVATRAVRCVRVMTMHLSSFIAPVMSFTGDSPPAFGMAAADSFAPQM